MLWKILIFQIQILKNFRSDGVEGIECFLEHGDTLFMPTGWWHWMKYLDGSFSISLSSMGQILGGKSQLAMESYSTKEF